MRIDELFLQPPRSIGRPARAPHQSKGWFALFAAIDAVLRVVEPAFPRALRRRAIDRAVAFVTERLNGESGLGAIFPAMANTVMMFEALGYPRDHPHLITARAAIDRLLIVGDREAYCQPCVSPIWDTALASHALLEVDDVRSRDAVVGGMRWLKSKQVLDVRGDWIDQRPDVRPGGWAFQYDNPHYPDLDDTAAVVLAMHRCAMTPAAKRGEFDESIARAVEWTVGLQSTNGGWGAFDADNTRDYLNNIPFADHGALLDPPTEDVTARCVGMLAQYGRPEHRDAMARGIRYLQREQRPDGSWYGRWGLNYLYGTWSALCGLAAAGFGRDAPEVRRAVEWLRSIQNDDGGWGEDAASYELEVRRHVPGPSTASQTAWALLGLMAAGEAHHDAVVRGVDWLIRRQGADGFWPEAQFTATGFPRVFYLRYHGYPKFFPLWALARYRRLSAPRGRDAALRPVTRGRADEARGRLLVVCGLATEARLARGADVRTVAGGGRSDALADAIEREAAAGVVAIASFGIGGALVPSLAPGALVVADRVVADGASWTCDVAWSDALARRIPHAMRGAIAGSERIVVDRDDKDALRRATGAVAVDMESQVAARIAVRHGLPFIALRAIADPLERTVPPAARVAMRDGGGIDLPAVLRSLLASPGQLRSLLAIAADTRTALRALGDGRRLAGDRLGYPDLDQLAVHVV